MQRVALLGLLVGCTANRTTADGPRRSAVVCDAASLDRTTRHRELSLSLVSSQPPQAILDAARSLDLPGLQVQYESSSPTYANATWQDLQNAGLMTRDQLEALFKFTCVRNPYDLLVSRYLKRKGRYQQDVY